MQFPHLFSPITINDMALKNRAVMPPMGTGYGNSNGTVSDQNASVDCR
jgi:2,4-dienoyl-CoA reductase-like NADH-dependent reductase (Old Yellow Enzyme family)